MSANLLLPYLNDIRVPTQQDRIFKDECIFSFDTPDSPDGIYVCMKTFLGFSRRFVTLYHARTHNAVFLRMRRVAHPKPKPASSGNSSSDEEITKKPKITKLALNMDGGFQTNEPQFEYEDINTLVLLPGFQEVELNQADLPDMVIMAVSGILSADSAARQAELDAMKNTWDGEMRKVSKHSDNLQQLPNPPKIPRSGWKCQGPDCDIRTSLWLNLTDGFILCGRKNFDGTGGNNHAAEHFKTTKYPLVVKLGTITSTGADVYSYEEDAMVDDPKLAAHLAHFGINLAEMQKTEKTMIEMEIDLNQRYDEWSAIQEDGLKLKALYGPTFTGMTNLGNSCYLNSIMQVLFSIPDFVEEFYRADPTVQFAQSNHTDPTGDLRSQLMKLASGLLSGDYSRRDQTVPNHNEQSGIKPRMFKSLIGRGHPEFSSKRQQDAQEFLLYVIDKIERMPKGPNSSPNGPPTDCFKFEVEQRVQCGQSKQVRYTTRSDFLLSLPIEGVKVQNQEEYETFLATKKAVEDAGGKIENDQVIHPIVRLVDCLSAFAQDVMVDDFYSPATNSKTFALMRTRLRSFPDYLVFHAKKFTLGADWTPKKLDVSLDVPVELDLEELRATGLQPDEVPLPEESKSPAASSQEPAFEPNNSFLQQLQEMGFDQQGCKRALFNTHNAGVEPAMNWILEHMGDADFAAPFVAPSPSGSGVSAPSSANVIEVDQAAMENIMSMGFEDRHARLGLKMNNNDTQRAIEWIFTNIAQMDQLEREQEERERAASVAASTSKVQTYRTGPPKYRLMALVSHMGQSTMCGHYVAHIRKTIRLDTVIVPEGAKDTKESIDKPAEPQTPNPETGSDVWTIFNDNKVAVSERPPVPLAYLYVYKRIE